MSDEGERLQAEGAAVMQEAQISPEDVGAVEMVEHGHLVALDMVIQCDGCLKRGEQTPLRITLVSDDSGSAAEKLIDLMAVCEKCTALEQQKEPNALVAIPVDVLVGNEVQFDELGDEEEGDGLPTSDDTEQPFDADVQVKDLPPKLPVE